MIRKYIPKKWKRLYRRFFPVSSPEVVTTRRVYRTDLHKFANRVSLVDLLWEEWPSNWSKVKIDEELEIVGDEALSIPLIQVAQANERKGLVIVQCRKTGMVFHQRMPSVRWLGDYYSSCWDTASEQPDISDPEKFSEKRGNKVKNILGCSEVYSVHKGSKVLDVGCGYGDQLFFFEQAGCEVTGIEPSSKRAEVASQIVKGEIFNLSMEAEGVGEAMSKLGERIFDFIFLNQVLEHLRDPLSILKALRNFVSSEGRLLIGVPDFFRESMVLFTGSIVHCNSFTKNSLSNVAAMAGWRVVEDLSFPGYIYYLLGPAEVEEDAIAPIQEREVQNHVLSCFGIAKDMEKGDVIVARSDYTGRMETGVRVKEMQIESSQSIPLLTLSRSELDPVLWMK